MSHITTATCRINDLQLLQKTCEFLQQETGRTDVYQQPRWVEDQRVGESRATGYAVNLENWQKPVIFDLEEGKVNYDNYDGRWGDVAVLDHLQQRYAAETLQQTAQQQGGYYTETELEDGRLAVAIHVGE